MKKTYSPRALNKAIKGINIPPVEDILPAGALEKNESKKSLITPFIFKRYGIAAAAAVLVITLSIPAVIHILDTPPAAEIPPSSTPYYSDWPVINYGAEDSTQDEWDNSGNILLPQVSGISAEEIEASVRERIEEFKGQDVLFYVFIRFPDFDDELYQPTDTNKEELERLSSEISRYDEQLDELRAEYAKTGDQNTKNRLDALLEERNAIWLIWYDLEFSDRKLFFAEMMEKEIEEITGQKIELASNEYPTDIRMHLPPEIIEKFLDNDDYFICFAQEETDDFPQDDELVCRDE